MTRLHLIRHGPTHAKTFVGWSDLPAVLSDIEALQRLSAFLPAGPIVSSDLIRSVATADAIAEDRQRLPHLPELREVNFGDWEQRSHSEIKQSDPERLQNYWQGDGRTTAPNGESWQDLRHRCDRAIDDLVQAHPGQDLIVVVHFGVILTQVQRAAQLSLQETLTHRIDNLSVTQITLNNQNWTVERINHCP